MTGRKYAPAVLILAGGVAVSLGWRNQSAGGDGPAPPAPAATVPAATPAAVQPPAKGEAAEAAIRALTAEYEKAFNAGDAKAAAALWTVSGEYVGVDGTVVAGRGAIEKDLADYFKAHPKAAAEIRVEGVRVLGRGIASADAVVRLTLPGEETPAESRYTALHVLEDGRWHAASVREWALDPATDVTPQALEWLVGEWAAKGEAGELRITYAWDEGRAFLNARYAVTGKDGKPRTTGLQVIGRNHGGGLRSWLFDSSGTTSHAVWVRDGTRWLSEAVGELPDGSEITALNVIVPVSPDSFTWQTTDRALNGEPLPALPPVKVTRVGK